VFLHHDIKKVIKGKEKHLPDRNEKRNMDEVYRIEKQLLSEKIGFLEIKDRQCAHATIDLKDKDALLKILNEEFKSYDKWKFRKKFNSSQCTISLFEQGNFMHVVCVHADIKNQDHVLNKAKSLASLKSILQRTCDDKLRALAV